jgi:signal transduction histidine kinase
MPDSSDTARVERDAASLAAELDALHRLHDVSTQLIHEDDVDALYEQILDAATRIMHSDFASLQSFHPERGEAGELRLLGCRGFDPRTARLWARVQPASICTSGVALRTGQRVMVPDVERWEPMIATGHLASYRAVGIRSAQTTPLLSRSGRILGMLSTYWSVPHAPSPAELRMVDILARQAADLIEQRETQRSLVESEALHRRTRPFETLLDLAPIGVYLLDTELRIRAVNRTALLVADGLPDLIGRTFSDVAHRLWSGPHAEELMARVRETLASGKSYQTSKAMEQRRDGGVTECREWQIDRISLAEGDPGVVCYFRDISAPVQASLADTDRRKDEFLATLGHELRSPMTALYASLETIRLRAGGPAVERPWQIVDRQLKHLLRLADDLLDLSRISRGTIELRKEWIEIAPVVEAAVDLSRSLMARHRFSLSLPPKPVRVHADAVRLAQVVSNLLDNAAKYTEPGGQIELRVEEEDEHVALHVRDTGIGISRSMLAKVFEPFTQLHSRREWAARGLGLGLNIVQRLVQMHGGSVHAHSRGRGRGSEFVVRIPLG